MAGQEPRHPELYRSVRNARLRQLWPIGPVLKGPRPMVNLSLAANYRLSGLEVWSYHALNLAVHLIAAVALMGVVRRTLLSGRAGRWARDAATPLAFASALLWAVHPLQTGSVTYVIQRSESMMGLFYIVQGINQNHLPFMDYRYIITNAFNLIEQMRG